MGSLTSRPKSVPIPQTVYVPNPQNVSQNVTIPTKAPSSISPTGSRLLSTATAAADTCSIDNEEQYEMERAAYIS